MAEYTSSSAEDVIAGMASDFLEKHGNRPVSYKALSELLKGQTAIIVDVISPLRQRIAALEAAQKGQGHAD